MKSIFLLLSASMVTILLSSCGKKEPVKIVDTDEGTIETTPNATTFTGVDGTKATMGQDVPLPDDFPEDIPMIEGQIVVATKSPKGHMVNLKSPKPPQEVRAFYKEKMAAESWEEETATELPNGGMFTFAKDGRKVHLVIAGTPSSTTVNITAN